MSGNVVPSESPDAPQCLSSREGLGFLGIGLSTASFIHRLSFSWWMGLVSGQVLLGATLLLFFLPRSVCALSTFLVASLVYWYQRLPFVPNHIFFEILVHVGMLGTIMVVVVTRWGKEKEACHDLGDSIYERIRPVVIASLIIMYLFTVLHKLNWDFLNPAVSCAVSMHKELASVVPFVPSDEWTFWPTIVGTLAIELLIPLGLWWRPTRMLAVVLGLFFHWFLALHPHGGIYSFSHLLYALYAVFLFSSKDHPCELWSGMPRWGGIVIKLLAVTIFGSGIFLQMQAYKTGQGFLVANAIGFYIWLLFAGFMASTYAAHFYLNPSRRLTAPEFCSMGCLWIFPVLVFLNGACPYLSLKTTTAFSMFSNIRTEVNANNHLFMPRLKLFGYQDDLVMITESNDRQLRQYAKTKDLIAWFEFQRIVASRKRADLFVRYSRNGVQATLERKNKEKRNEGQLMKHPWYLAKFLVFRPIGRLDKPMPCRH